MAAQKIIISMMTFPERTPASVVVLLPESHCWSGRKMAYFAALTTMLASSSTAIVRGQEAPMA